MTVMGRPDVELMDQRRRRYGLSKRQHAKRAGVAFSTLLAFEAGKRATHPVNAHRIARVLGLRVEDLYTRESA